ncbi:MAG: hypothetical protein ACJASQ_001116 [Crocinitomicaceae bacterium]|jgi:hypothetical protein
MIYPLIIKKTIVVNQNASDFPSEDVVLRHIDEHMEQFDMFKHKYPNNEMYYYNVPLMRLFRRKDLIGNISITVACTKQEIITVLKTNTIRIFIPLFLLLIGVPLITGNPFSRPLGDSPFIWFIIAYVLIVFAWQFRLRNIALKRLSNEIESIIQSLYK